MNKKYKHILFDFDGVLCDSAEIAMMEFNRIAKANFPSLPIMRSTKDFEIVFSGSLRGSLTNWLSDLEEKDFFTMHSAAMRNNVGKLSAFKGISDILTQLPRDAASVVTSAYSDAVKCVLGMKNCESFFSIAGRELHMPKTVKIRKILDDLHIDPSEAVYVGDLESDIIYCKKVPIDIISVGYGYHSGAFLQRKGCEYLASSVNELDLLIKQLVEI